MLELLGFIEKNEDFREAAFKLIDDNFDGCGDRIAHTFATLRARMKTHEAGKAIINGQDPDGKTFKAILKSVYLLAKVEQEAAIKATKANKGYESIEWSLYLQIFLRKKLGLPEDTRCLSFGSLVSLKKKEIDEIGNKILKEFNESEFNLFLNQQPAWQHVRSKHVTPYEKLPVICLNPADGLETQECPLAQDVPKEPVLFNKKIYEFDLLREQYMLNGIDPLNRAGIIDWNKLARVDLPRGEVLYA